MITGLFAVVAGAAGAFFAGAFDGVEFPWESTQSDASGTRAADCGFEVSDELLFEAEVAGGAVINGRCSQDPDAPTGTYEDPSQASRPVERLDNDEIVASACVTDGQAISDEAGTSSVRWVRYDAGDGEFAFVPEVWTESRESLPAC